MSFSPEKLFLVGLIALMVLGPNRLPDVARRAGRTLAEMRRMSSELQGQVTRAMAEPVESVGLPDPRAALSDAGASVRRAMEDAIRGPSPATVPLATIPPTTVPPTTVPPTMVPQPVAPQPTASILSPSFAGPGQPDDPTLN